MMEVAELRLAGNPSFRVLDLNPGLSYYRYHTMTCYFLTEQNNYNQNYFPGATPAYLFFS